MSIFPFPWPPPLRWNPVRRFSGNCSIGASYIWLGKKSPQPEPVNAPSIINTLWMNLAFFGQEQTLVNTRQNIVLPPNYQGRYEISGLGLSWMLTNLE